MPESLVLRNLNVEISGRRILTELQLTVAPNEFVVLLGKSGSGKTTLLRTLAGEIEIESGEVLRSGRTGYAQQAAPLFPWLNVLENVVLASKEDPEKARVQARALLARVDLLRAENLKPYQLSGGMKSRVALVRAFMDQPSLVLMDEPFNGLDLQTREELQAITIELWRETASAILLVSHDLDEAIRLGDRLLVLGKNGDQFTLDERNSIARPRPKRSVEIQTNPEFRRMWILIQDALV